MAEVYGLREAKARLSALLDRVAAGGEVEIVRGGRKRDRFRVLVVEADGASRRPGALAGRIVVPKGFDEEDPAVTSAFDGPR